jgi:hypothetical protein
MAMDRRTDVDEGTTMRRIALGMTMTAVASAAVLTGPSAVAATNSAGAFVVTSEAMNWGSITSGDYTRTRLADGVSENITEGVPSYEPSHRLLDHKWNLANVPAGAYNLKIVARKNIADAERFSFRWDGGTGGNTVGACALDSDSGTRVITCEATVIAGTTPATITVRDSFDRESSPNTLSVDYIGLTRSTDVTAPSVAVTPAATTTTDWVSITATASDNSGKISHVELVDPNGTVVETLYSAPYSFWWNAAPAGAGTHTLTVKAYDPSGNVGTARASVTVVADTAAPTVRFISPAGGATLSGYTEISADVQDNGVVDRVEFYLDGKLLATEPYGPYVVGWNTTDSANGSHTLRVRAFDGAGNVGTSAITVNVNNVTPPPPATANLSVSASGRTGVRITSNPVGITVASGQTRTASYTVGTAVRLTVGGGRTAVFSGACSTGGVARAACTFTLQADDSVSARIK